MRRTHGEKGSALILLLGITATLAILATTAVFVLGNQQHATAADRTRTQSFDYAEAGLDSAVMAVRTQTWPAANNQFSSSSLTAAYDATYPSASRPPLIVKVYDNQGTVNEAITWDKGGPTATTTPDGRLWVETCVTVGGKSSRVRTLVGQVNTASAFTVPAAAIYTDGNVAFTTGGGDAFGITYDANGNWIPDTAKSAAIYAGGSFTGNWSTDLNPNGGASTLAIKTNGTVYNPKLDISPAVAGTGGVASLGSVLPQTTIDTMKSQAQRGLLDPVWFNQHNASGTVVLASVIAGNTSYSAATDVKVVGDLTMGAGTRTFKSLYVTGNLTQNGGGTFKATSLYVGGNLLITSTSGTFQLGPIYVGGEFQIGGGPVSIKTTDYTDASKAPAPLYVAGNLNEPSGGAYTHVWGPTYVGGFVTFAGNSSQILCPLLVTPGQVTTGGSGSFGTVDDPMVLLGLNDNNGSSKAMQLSADATFTGLVINMDGGVNLDNDGDGGFFIRGAAFATGDVKFTNGGAQLGYDPKALANLHVTASTTATTVIPGTWQELSSSGN
jgi:Tfp pilus assembly protein PilX